MIAIISEVRISRTGLFPMKLVSAHLLAAFAAIGVFLTLPERIACAATVEELYTVVIEQNPAAVDPRRDAMERAMAQVLVRVTGSTAAAEAPELQAIVRNPERGYLNSYAFLQGREVQVGFIARNVNDALTRLNWPVWGEERPFTMFLIAIDWSSGDRALVSSGEFDTGFEHDPEMQDLIAVFRDELANAADARGLPYAVPAFDLTDMVAVDFADVWNLERDALQDVSLRYAADAIVIGRLQEVGFGLEANWMLQIGDDFQSLAGAAVREVVDGLADRYAADFAVLGGVRSLELRISGVSDLGDYGTVLSYLNSLSILEQIDVSSYQDGLLTLQVASRGDGSVLSRVLGLNDLLTRGSAIGSADPFGERLDYEFGAGLQLQ